MKKVFLLLLIVFFANSIFCPLVFAKQKEIVYSDNLFFNINTYNKIFSPNNDGFLDELILEFVPLKNKKDIKVKEWNLNIINEQTKQIVFSVDGEKSLPEKIVWNGSLSDGTTKEGFYKYEFTAVINKKHIRSTDDKILIDVTAPFISLNSSSNIAVLSDENRFKKSITFNINMGDETGIDTSKSKLKIVNSRKKVVKEWVFQTFKDIPSSIVWDGKDDIYSRLVPADEYDVILTVYDVVNNKEEIISKLTVLEAIKGNIEDIRVKDEPSLEIVLPNKILFDTNSSELNEKSEKTLQDVVVLLKDYPTDKVLLKGYMDSSETNISESDEKISLSRAKKVFDFLMQNGIKEDRIILIDNEDAEYMQEDGSAVNAANNMAVDIVIFTDID